MRTNLLCLLSVVVLAGACRSGENPQYDLSPGKDLTVPDLSAVDAGMGDMADAGIADLAGSGDDAGEDLGPRGDMPTFEAVTNYAVGSGPIYLAAGDVNKDGTPDLVVANTNKPSAGIPATVSILLGKGDGTFDLPTVMPISPGPFAVSLGTFKAGGKKDIVVTTGDGFDYLAGNGDGTFASPQHTVVGTSGFDRGGAIADIDGDGKLDYVIAELGDGTSNGLAWIVPGHGDGTFGSPVSFAVSTQGDPNAVRRPIVVRAATMNTDAKLDLVLGNANTDGTSSITILLNLSAPGALAFSAPTEIVSDKVPFDLILGQADGAHKTDIMSVNIGASTVSVYLSNTDNDTVSFAAPVSYALADPPTAIAAGDIDGDTKGDLVVTDRVNHVNVLYGDGTGKFGVSTGNRPGVERFTVGNDPISLVLGTFNNDIKLDVATANQTSNDVSVLLNAL